MRTPHDTPVLPRQAPPEAAAVPRTPEQEDLAAALTGRLVLPGEPGFDDVARTDDQPAAVVVAGDPADVALAVRAARQAGLRLAVAGPGHAVVAGAGRLVVSTAALDHVSLDPAGRATVGAGARWRDLVEAAAPYGLGPVTGPCLDEHVLSAGAGLGPLARTFGPAGDRVTALHVVTADGVRRRVSPAAGPDLFWALRGGHAPLGVVTDVELELVPVVLVHGGTLWFDASDGAALLRAWRAWAQDLPRPASTSVALVDLAGRPSAPAGPVGRRAVAVRFAHVGDAAVGEALLAPVREVAPPLLDRVGVLPYADVGAVEAVPTAPAPDLLASALLDTLPDDAVTALAAAASGGALTVVEVRLLAPAPTGPAYALRLLGTPGVAARAAAGQALAALRPWTTGSGPPPDRVRLEQLVRRWDPDRLLV